MTVTDVAAAPAPVRRASPGVAFRAMLLRDFVVLRKNLGEFIPRTILQPLLLVFVFTYVFPKIGQGVGGSNSAAFSTLLVAGVVATAIMFQGIQAVALPMVQEFGYTREIEDRVLAPMRVEWVAVQKIVGGALQCLLAGAIVFPIAWVVPATPVDIHVNWLILLTLGPLACLMAGAVGLFFGTIFDPRTVPLLFGVIIVPITFLGCVYYSWQSLAPIKWLQVITLANPLVYMCEGFRAAVTNSPHMSLLVIYPVMIGFTVLFGGLGIRFFTRRVIA